MSDLIEQRERVAMTLFYTVALRLFRSSFSESLILRNSSLYVVETLPVEIFGSGTSNPISTDAITDLAIRCFSQEPWMKGFIMTFLYEPKT